MLLERSGAGQRSWCQAFPRGQWGDPPCRVSPSWDISPPSLRCGIHKVNPAVTPGCELSGAVQHGEPCCFCLWRIGQVWRHHLPCALAGDKAVRCTRVSQLSPLPCRELAPNTHVRPRTSPEMHLSHIWGQVSGSKQPDHLTQPPSSPQETPARSKNTACAIARLLPPSASKAG